jgi:hypothetical protein
MNEDARSEFTPLRHHILYHPNTISRTCFGGEKPAIRYLRCSQSQVFSPHLPELLLSLPRPGGSGIRATGTCSRQSTGAPRLSCFVTVSTTSSTPVSVCHAFQIALLQHHRCCSGNCDC